MADTAYRLAALRATRLGPAGPDRRSLDAAAAAIGRRVVDVGDQWMLGPDPTLEPDPTMMPVRQLTTVPVVAFGVCLGLCWVDRTRHPHPGVATSLDAVLAELGRLGVRTAGALHHFKGALAHDLHNAGLIVRADDRIALGPVVAGWTDAQVALLRRAEHLLSQAAL